MSLMESPTKLALLNPIAMIRYKWFHKSNIQGGSSPYNVCFGVMELLIHQGVILGQGLYEAVITDNNGCQMPFSTLLDGANEFEITSIDVDSLQVVLGQAQGKYKYLA